MIRRSIAVATLLLLALFGFAAAPAWGDASIRILVNDKPITSNDVAERTRMIRLFTQGTLGEKAAIEQLITETLMLQEAERQRVTVTEAEVDAELAVRASSANMTAAQFQQAMQESGINLRTFRAFLRANLAWARIVRGRFRATVNITEFDVAAALTGRQSPVNEQAATEYLLQKIVFVVPAGAGESVWAQQRREAAAFRAAFRGCDHSLEQATGNPSIVVSQPARHERLLPELKAVLDALDVGGITEPATTSNGIEVIGICAKRAITGRSEAEAEVREEISSERGQLLARRYLRDLRSDAVIEYR
jgi:peptidyl-prolyl cis-trans isomerase SurA